MHHPLIRSRKSQQTPCKSVENSNEIQLKGIATMDLFGIELENPIIVQDILENDVANDIVDLCKNLCSLSQLPLWQSTGIFNRIFQYRDNDSKLYGKPKSSNTVDFVANPRSYNNICKDYCVF